MVASTIFPLSQKVVTKKIVASRSRPIGLNACRNRMVLSLPGQRRGAESRTVQVGAAAAATSPSPRTDYVVGHERTAPDNDFGSFSAWLRPPLPTCARHK